VEKHEGWGTGAGDLPALTDADWRQIHAQYYGMVELIDHSVGRILKALEEQGLAENTAVIFTSDHGELFGDHGLLYKGPFPYEGLYRLPFVARIPGVTKPGTRASGLGTLLDLAPTFADLAGVESLPSFQGRSMLPWLGGGDGREAVLVEFVSRYYPELTLMTAVTERWKLTHYPNWDRGELYDVHDDPGELVNRWGDPAVADVQREMEGRLLDLTAEAIGRLPTPQSHA
jgi:arylsulfatase A-like enzyme